MADLPRGRLLVETNFNAINNTNTNTNTKEEEEKVKGGGGADKDMAPLPSSLAPIHHSSSRPQLDLSGAAIQGNFEEKDPTILLPNQSDDISHLALDIGGSLIKLVYFSRHEDRSVDDKWKRFLKERLGVSNGSRKSYPILGGRLHFVKFETMKINECLDFIYSKQLHRGGIDPRGWRADAQVEDNTIIKTTGGGAYKFADLCKERLGVSLEKKDEMDCLVAGANFLLKAIRHEAFTHMEGQKEFVQIDQNDLFPYLLVNIGSGVSMIKVDGEGNFQRVSGTNVGGGTYWGLGKLLTKCKSFDELLELSQRGDNKVIDMLVGDIYGGMDSFTKQIMKHGLPSRPLGIIIKFGLQNVLEVLRIARDSHQPLLSREKWYRANASLIRATTRTKVISNPIVHAIGVFDQTGQTAH